MLRVGILAFALAVLISGLANILATPVGAQEASAPARPTGLTAEPSHNSVALSWDDSVDASITHYEVYRRDRDRHESGEFISISANTGSAETRYTDDTAQPLRRYRYRVKAVNQNGASRWSRFAGADTPEAPIEDNQHDPAPITRDEGSAAVAGAACPDRDSEPTPVHIVVDAVPIVVSSTTDDYFVLYVNHAEDGRVLELPVLVKKGAAGATTLDEHLEALPVEHYRVEKYLIAEPADVDRDCIDDITELDGYGIMNPVNVAASIAFMDGTVAIPDRETFERLSYQGDEVLIDLHLAGLEFVKFFIFRLNSGGPTVYFMNTVEHRYHWSFAATVDFRLMMGMRGEIIFHPNVAAPDGSLGVYRFEFEPLDSYPFRDVQNAYEALAANMPLLENNLAYYPMPTNALPRYRREQAKYDASRVKVLLEQDIFPDVEFISLNQGTGYGFLRAMSFDERSNPRDIVIYESLPNDLPRVAGIITTVPQTPLSHVNLRAVQDRVPNAFIRDALDAGAIDDLIDSHVQYTVTRDAYTIRAATKAEVDTHYETSRPTETQTPVRDLSVTEIAALSDIGFDDWDAFGVKAANLAVLGTLNFPDGTVPDGFAVPFYFYDEFMKANDLYSQVSTMLADPNFQTDYDRQEAMLKELRDAIKDATTPDWIITALAEMHAAFPPGTSLRYRSSTNNEDLPGFSGAGLYDSKTQDPDETVADGIDKSIKGVWASLWNFRAVVERDFHRIDHYSTAMGVLVHPNYSDELVNGVAVSFDPFDLSAGSYYVNSQVGEDLVTNPDMHSVPEQLLLAPVGSSDEPYTILRASNQVAAGQLLMSETQMAQLRQHLEAIHDHFNGLYQPGPDEPFAMEIEFKITAENILAIKQARPWVFGPTPVTTTTTTTTTTASARTSATTVLGRESVRLDGTASDPQGDPLSYAWSSNGGGTFANDSELDTTWTAPAAGFSDREIRLTLTVTDTSNASATTTVTVTVQGNQAPTATATGRPTTVGGGGLVTLNGTVDDPEDDQLTYRWSSNGGGSFEDEFAEQTTWTAPPKTDNAQSITLTLTATDDGAGPLVGSATVEITVPGNTTVTTVTGGGGGGGGGGGPPPVPVPSDKEFDWNVSSDIELLAGANDLPTGLWSDGATLWVVENSSSEADRVFAYDLMTGERQPDAEFEFESRNRFSHGIWSDGETVWIADSGQDRLFAYNLVSGERLEERDLELAERNRDPRGIWSDGETMYMLDSVKDSLFVYDFESGELLAEYPLDKLNKSPRGLWSDGVTLWVSDDGAKRLFAYRIKDGALVRHEDEEFTFRSLLKAGNGAARGIWSDGDVIYVADEQDDHVYTYNLPDAIDARLATLSLSGVEIDEFSPSRLTYDALAETSATVTTIEAVATQETATVVIEPSDTDGDAENGHQVALEAETEIAITVTSSDGSRQRSYQVLVEKPPCLTGLTTERLSEVTFVGGSVDDLSRCAREQGVAAFFHWTGESWLLYAPDAPAILNRPFRDRFINGVPTDATFITAAARIQSTEN